MEGKFTVLITGANRGIGYSITVGLLKAGHLVFAVSKSDNNLQLLKKDFDNLFIIKENLQTMDGAQSVLNTVKLRGGNIDVLINNAGIGRFAQVENLSIDSWQQIIQLNLTVPFFFINQLLPDMKKRNFGRIINIGSNADSIPEANCSAYCASKYGLLGLSQCVRLETKGYNISITTISPGRVDTYFNNKTPGDRPLALQPEDIFSSIKFILESHSRCSIEQIKIESNLE